VLFVVWLEPLQSIGQNTFIADALRWAGAESVITTHQPWPHLSIEEVVRLQPEYIVFADDHNGAAAEIADLRARPVWRDLDAVERGRVVNVNREIVRPSPGLVDVIEQLAHDVHSEAFAASERRDSRLVSGKFYAHHQSDPVGAGFKPAPTCSISIQDAATCAR
jgi:iron complex transport system substrate-binding protein